MIYEAVEFPAVTFCNLNSIMKSRLSLGGEDLQHVVDSAQQAYAAESGDRQKRSVSKHLKNKIMVEKVYPDSVKDMKDKRNQNVERMQRTKKNQNVERMQHTKKKIHVSAEETYDDATEMKKQLVMEQFDVSHKAWKLSQTNITAGQNQTQRAKNASDKGYENRWNLPSTPVHIGSRHKRTVCE